MKIEIIKKTELGIDWFYVVVNGIKHYGYLKIKDANDRVNKLIGEFLKK